MAKIKICGLRRMEDIEVINEVKPDFAGFIVEVPKSSRNVTAGQVRELAAALAPEVIPVGVFCDADPKLPAQLANEGTIRRIQLHGHEDEEYIRKLRQMTDTPVVKAFSIKKKEDIDAALASTADYILLDQGGGGTGKTFDWSLVPAVERPWFLAGGLSIDNIKEAIDRLQPWAVDLSSSLETDGYKDPEKIRAIMNIVRS